MATHPLDQTLDRANSEVVLIVDDVPDNLSVLHDALDESGYTVLVATHGEAALQRATQALPDIVLLDAMMPGMDGFEVARRLKRDAGHRPHPHHLHDRPDRNRVPGGRAGGRRGGLRHQAHQAQRSAGPHGRAPGRRREKRQARNALDAFGYATITVRASDGRLMWQTALARQLLEAYFGPPSATVPEVVRAWLQRQLPVLDAQSDPPRLAIEQGARRLTFRLHQQTGDGAPNEPGGDWLIVMREVSDATIIESMSLSFKLTAREAEVLYWVVKGKINRDIADILGASPATVKKHLERVFAKLGVETRTAAAGMAMNRIRQLHPQFEG